MSTKWVYAFNEGDGKNKRLLGGKGANLCEMTQIGLKVPPGFVITTEACLAVVNDPKKELPNGMMEQVHTHLADVEHKSNRIFGGRENPLLISVRSGSAMSMPGMMDTILNLGLNAETLQGLIAQTGNDRFCYDAYRRFIQLFGKVALGVPEAEFDAEFEAVKQKAGAKHDVDLSSKDLAEITKRFLGVVQRNTGKPFPADPREQLEIAIRAVFDSWGGKRAVDYRREFKITPDMANGTAVNVMQMVFGNMGNDSATGVGFTRDPGTGENIMFGEYLVNAQGEDVVAGIRTPKPVAAMAEEMPGLYRELQELRNKLETHYKEVQDFEFTIEKGTLYCLQTRNGKMNAHALVRTSVEMVEEGLIDKRQALLRIQPEMLEQMLFPRLDPKVTKKPIAKGLPASPGVAIGVAVFDADRAEKLGRTGKEIPWVSDILRILRRNPRLRNIYFELGSTFQQLSMSNPTRCLHMLGQMLKVAGPDRILWGTDSIWGGSPQSQIERFRRLRMTQELIDKFEYPALTDDVKDRILGLNAARIWNVDAKGRRNAIRADRLTQIREEYRRNPTPSNTQFGWVWVGDESPSLPIGPGEA